MNEDRIKLAEAMGWFPTSIYTSPSGERDVTSWRSPSGKSNQKVRDLPDPFTDANDDYAVLEWMRDNYHSSVIRKALEPFQMEIWSYGVGDYARAALAVLKDEKGRT